MAVTQTLQFEQLDDASREYLTRVRAINGQGMPGVYVPVTDSLPGFGCFFGILVLLLTVVASAVLIDEEPLAVAMLQTAGILLGGWLVVYALRSWMKGRKSIGSFVYADAQTLWQCSGSTVRVTNLAQLSEAMGVHRSNNQGAYTHTVVTVRAGGPPQSFNVSSESRAQELVIFLNALVWIRDNEVAELSTVDKSSPALTGLLAREVAQTGEMPQNVSADLMDLKGDHVPLPEKAGRASFGLIAYLVIIAIAIGGVFVLKGLNVGWRDDAIWTNINKFSDIDHRAPWLRAYLADDRNVKHRDEAKAMLRQTYANAVARIRNGFIQNQPEFNPALIVNPNAAPVNNRVDKSLVDSLEVVLLSIAEQPLALASIRVKEQKGPSAGAAEREKVVRDNYSRALEEGVGKNLIAFVEAPADVPAMVDVSYTITPIPTGRNNDWRIVFTLTVRKAPDGEPAKTVVWTATGTGDAQQAIASQATQMGLKTAGTKKLELEVIEDF